MSTIPDITKQSRAAMEKAVENTRREFSHVRSGKASPNMLDTVRVEMYGQTMQLNQVATVSAPEPRLLVVTPFDKGAIKSIEKAILNSDLGINPSNDGQVIRLVFPQLTSERRKELVKVVRHKAEEGRVAARNIRREARRELEALEKDGEISADDLERAEKEMEKLTHEYVAEIDRMLARKEQELLEV